MADNIKNITDIDIDWNLHFIKLIPKFESEILSLSKTEIHPLDLFGGFRIIML